jgi:hypothetical protein
MSRKILILVLIFLISIQTVSAYTLNDFISYVQSLFFSGQKSTKGSVFQLTDQCYGGDGPDCDPNSDTLKWNCHPYYCSLYEKQNDKEGCEFAGCTVHEFILTPWACGGYPNSCENYDMKTDCQRAGCFWRESTETTTSTPAEALGEIQGIIINLLDSNCEPKQTWLVYYKGEQPRTITIPEWKKGDCPPGNIRIDMEYKNTGSMGTSFRFESQTIGLKTNNKGLRISAPINLVDSGASSTDLIWIPMWPEDIKEKNWLMVYSPKSGTFEEVGEIDLEIRKGQPTEIISCGCKDPDSPNKYYFCSDGTDGYCFEDETCYGITIKPDRPCKKITSTTSITSTTTVSTAISGFCHVGKECYSKTIVDCDEGIWIIKNHLNSNSLPTPKVGDIPKDTIEYASTKTGKIDLISICFEPEIKIQKTVIHVYE